MNDQESKVPQYTKIGGRIALALLLLLGLVILRNCINSYIYGVNTEQEELAQYYGLGVEHGAQAARGINVQQPAIDNPLLRKTYQKGYRDGWDGARLKDKTSSRRRAPGNA